jgi:hypothetical protein
MTTFLIVFNILTQGMAVIIAPFVAGIDRPFFRWVDLRFAIACFALDSCTFFGNSAFKVLKLILESFLNFS